MFNKYNGNEVFHLLCTNIDNRQPKTKMELKS